MILFDCREVSRRVSRGDYDQASRLTRMLVRAHQAMCGHCARYARQMALIAQALREVSERSINRDELADLEKRIIVGLGGGRP